MTTSNIAMMDLVALPELIEGASSTAVPEDVAMALLLFVPVTENPPVIIEAAVSAAPAPLDAGEAAPLALAYAEHWKFRVTV
jgi:hypothetical protein